ncbi:unnamed protein product [Zymoseptoria tritici ST99CH_3D7]|uniref:Uncharacterized protein n=1 Tax=Zymoseptoria tritici (strain ST99CH_3D7) TaxID=1276538 RepID=A0A1X7RG62_ZYMT9|nr:unnamed protein product [Zymoseptoria tritici ST99CH_3D7]
MEQERCDGPGSEVRRKREASVCAQSQRLNRLILSFPHQQHTHNLQNEAPRGIPSPRPGRQHLSFGGGHQGRSQRCRTSTSSSPRALPSSHPSHLVVLLHQLLVAPLPVVPLPLRLLQRPLRRRRRRSLTRTWASVSSTKRIALTMRRRWGEGRFKAGKQLSGGWTIRIKGNGNTICCGKELQTLCSN